MSSPAGIMPDFAAAATTMAVTSSSQLLPRQSSFAMQQQQQKQHSRTNSGSGSNSNVFKSIDEEVSDAQRKFSSAQQRVEAVVTKVRLAAAPSEQLDREVKDAERDLTIALEILTAVIRKTQTVAEQEISAAEKTLQRLLA